MTMATCTESAGRDPDPAISDPSLRTIGIATVLAVVAVGLTRLPVARPAAFDFDEIGYLAMIRGQAFPMHHTLFLASARVLGRLVGEPYRGFVLLDAIVSALALVAVWWWLRAVVGPRASAAGACTLGAGPVFWAYGAMAGNYTAIPLVGSILLGIAYRGRTDPRPWHPYLAAVVLALGTGYRQDIGTFWLPVFLVILWQHRWLSALQAGLIFTAVNLAWFVPMLREAGGWTLYRQASSEFAYKAGYLNSYWNLGFRDAPLRYTVKAAMALLWTLGPGLVFVPRGAARLRSVPRGGFLAALMALSVLPALGSHLLVHFGVPGYGFHYVPALLVLVALGIGKAPQGASQECRLAWLACGLGALFLLYPTNYRNLGARGDFDLAFARHTRIGLQTPTPLRDPSRWRTRNSQSLPPPVEGVTIRSHIDRLAVSGVE